MSKSATLLSALTLICLGGLSAFAWQTQPKGNQSTPRPRTAVAALKAGMQELRRRDITILRLYGFDTTYTPWDPLVVRDHRMIREFLSALSRAEIVPTQGGAPMRDTLEICWKGQPERGVPPGCYELAFEPNRPRGSFGRAFTEALKALERYEAGRMRQRAASLRGWPVTVWFAPDEGEVYVDPVDQRRAKAFIDALSRADERAFALTSPSAKMLLARVEARGKAPIVFHLLVAPPSTTQQGKPTPKWHETLWAIAKSTRYS